MLLRPGVVLNRVSRHTSFNYLRNHQIQGGSVREEEDSFCLPSFSSSHWANNKIYISVDYKMKKI